MDALTDEFASAISIHALRVEGDCAAEDVDFAYGGFLSTPSGWRATFIRYFTGVIVEFLSTPSGWRATRRSSTRTRPRCNFYPRPPGGGRRVNVTSQVTLFTFLSTPSGWRATKDFLFCYFWVILISIHALRVEGDRICSACQ